MKSGKRTANYPMGSVSCATMREEDLIPTFCYELQGLARQTGILPAKSRRQHAKLAREIERRIELRGETEDDAEIGYYESEDAEYDLESLCDALGEYAAPYFYFGAHPGDGSDYGFWLSEEWDEEFSVPTFVNGGNVWDFDVENIKVSDLSEVPVWFRGEVAVVNDHGNVTLYFKTSRTLREIWAIV
jgi:hypothetical protein